MEKWVVRSGAGVRPGVCKVLKGPECQSSRRDPMNGECHSRMLGKHRTQLSMHGSSQLQAERGDQVGTVAVSREAMAAGGRAWAGRWQGRTYW